MPRRRLHTDGMRSDQLEETWWGETVIATCKGLISQLPYQLSINKALKHIINLSMFKHNLDGTCIKDTDDNIYKCSEHSHNNIIWVFLHGRHCASWFEKGTWPNAMIYLLQDILWKNLCSKQTLKSELCHASPKLMRLVFELSPKTCGKHRGRKTVGPGTLINCRAHIGNAP